MNLNFEADLRKAERTINALIDTCKLNGGGVYIGNKGGSGFCEKLTEPISITYWVREPLKEE